MRKAMVALLLTLLTTSACSQIAADAEESADERNEALVKECRDTTKDCLVGAVSVTDITACRAIFKDCVGDLVQTTDDVLVDAIELADEAIEITSDEATGLIDDVLGIGASPGSLAKDCRASAKQCLKGVVTLSDIKECQNTFDACIDDVTSLAGIGIELGGVISVDLGKAGPGCSLEVSACLGAGQTPKKCALGAQICLGKH